MQQEDIDKRALFIGIQITLLGILLAVIGLEVGPLLTIGFLVGLVGTVYVVLALG